MEPSRAMPSPPKGGANSDKSLHCARSLQHQLEAVMGCLEPQCFVEAMCLRACVVRGELHSIAPEPSSTLNGRAHEDSANPEPSMVRVHMNGLDFGTKSALGLHVPEDDELADPHHLASHFGDQDSAGTLRNLGQGSAIRGENGRVFFSLDQ